MQTHDKNTVSLQHSEPKLFTNLRVIVGDSEIYIDHIPTDKTPDKEPKSINPNIPLIDSIQQYCNTFDSLDSLYDSSSVLDTRVDTIEQYDSNYTFGAYSVVGSNSKYKNMFAFHAPICVNDKVPDLFIVRRYDAIDNVNYSTQVNNSNLVKIFDLRKDNSKIGKLLNEYFIIDSSKDNVPISANFDNKTIMYSGYSLKTGLQERVTEDVLGTMIYNERTISEFDNHATNGFKRNSLIPNKYLNIDFLFDDNSEVGFCKYVGYYANIENGILEPLSFDFTDKRLYYVEGATGVLSEQRNNIETIPTYTKKVREYTELVKEKTPYTRFDVAFNPTTNSNLTITYNSEIILDVKFTSDIIFKSPYDTTNNLVNIINYYPYNSAITLWAIGYTNKETKENYVIVEASINSKSYENIEITSKPKQFTFINDVNNKPFRIIQKNKVVKVEKNVDLVNITTDYSKLVYKNKEYAIIRKFVGMFDIDEFTYLEIDAKLSDYVSSDNNFSFVRIFDCVYYNTSIVNHVIFDKDVNRKTYYNKIDFDISLYKEELLSTIATPEFLGKYTGFTPTEQELIDYKLELVDVINNYTNVDLSDPILSKILIERIDNENSVYINSDSEYDHLREYSTVEKTKYNDNNNNTLKYAIPSADNALGLPYRLNISLPFRYDNISPNIFQNERLLSLLSHNYFVMPYGLPEYIVANPEYYLNKTNIYSSFSNDLLTIDDVNDYNLDITTKLEHNILNDTNKTKEKIQSYVDVKYDINKNECYAFFRGIMYKMSARYNGYRLTVLMFTDEQYDKEAECFVVENDKFKTIAICIKFYVPEPILTNLEGERNYKMDRSLFYMSESSNTTETKFVDFGESDISIKIRDNATNKTLFRNISTNNWIYDYSPTERYFCCLRGDGSRFNNSFIEIMQINTDFEYYVAEIDTIDYSNYGLKVTIKNIVDIGVDYFWCEDIELTQEFGDITGFPDIDLDVDTITVSMKESINTYGESELFDKVNIFNVFESTSYYNAKYNKVLGQTIYTQLSDFIKRYSNVSAYSYYNTLLKNDYIKIVKPIEFDVITNLYVNDNNIEKSNTHNIFKVCRYNANYIPITLPIYVHDLENSDIMNTFTQAQNIRCDSDSSKFAYINDYKFTTHKYYERSNSDKVEVISWETYPNEIRSFSSLCLNTKQLFSVDINIAQSVFTIDIMAVYKPIFDYIIAKNPTYGFTYDKLLYIVNKIFDIESITSNTDGTKYKYIIENGLVIIIDRQLGLYTDADTFKIILTR